MWHFGKKSRRKVKRYAKSAVVFGGFSDVSSFALYDCEVDSRLYPINQMEEFFKENFRISLPLVMSGDIQLNEEGYHDLQWWLDAQNETKQHVGVELIGPKKVPTGCDNLLSSFHRSKCNHLNRKC